MKAFNIQQNPFILWIGGYRFMVQLQNDYQTESTTE